MKKSWEFDTRNDLKTVATTIKTIGDSGDFLGLSRKVGMKLGSLETAWVDAPTHSNDHFAFSAMEADEHWSVRFAYRTKTRAFFDVDFYVNEKVNGCSVQINAFGTFDQFASAVRLATAVQSQLT